MKPLISRVLPWLLLPGLLSGCTVYDRLFHPHRLGTPPITAAAKAKYKAAEKARHKGLTLGAPATDGKATATKAGDDASAAAPADAGGNADAASPTPAAEPAPEAKTDSKGLPDNVRNTYDKNGHLKRSVLQRMEASSRQRHHYDMSFRGHTDMARDARKHRKPTRKKGSKGAPEKDPADDPNAGPEPTPDPTQPAEAPAAKPTARPAAKAKAKATPRPAVKPHPAAKPAPRPAAKPAATPAATDADAPQPEDRKAKKEKSAKVKKPKRDKNGNKLPKADPTQPAED